MKTMISSFFFLSCRIKSSLVLLSVWSEYAHTCFAQEGDLIKNSFIQCNSKEYCMGIEVLIGLQIKRVL